MLPTIHVRIGDSLFLHGSSASRMLQALADPLLPAGFAVPRYAAEFSRPMPAPRDEMDPGIRDH